MFSKSFEDLKLIFFKTFLLKLSIRLFPREDRLNTIFVSSPFIAYYLFKKIMVCSLPPLGGTGACYSHIIRVANMDVMPFQY